MLFLHAADIHLDSPLRGLARYPGLPAERLRLATREAFANLIDLAIVERVDLVVLAGDLYDGEWPDVHTGLTFVAAMTRLAQAGIAAVIVQGNHDAAAKITRALPLPPGVHVLPSDRPATVLIGEHYACHGQSYAVEATVENLAQGYPAPVPGRINIGVLHTALSGRADGHMPYAPCTTQDLMRLGYEYWALGHVHRRQVVESDPPIVYPGNLQGRHARETGAKGAMLVRVIDGRCVPEFRALDVIRWERVEIAASDCPSPDGLRTRLVAAVDALVGAAEGRFLVVRAVVQGADPALAAYLGGEGLDDLRAAVLAIGGVALEKVEVVEAAAIEAEAGDASALAALLHGADPAEEVFADVRRLLEVLPDALKDDPAFAPEALLRTAEAVALAHLSDTST
ncbi:MAG: DNA repair exonuclease [Alphaproteobacteria bacterium]|nr:DNA repair exonuclease [Alphaproteobacteria bacterium]